MNISFKRLVLLSIIALAISCGQSKEEAERQKRQTDSIAGALTDSLDKILQQSMAADTLNKASEVAEKNENSTSKKQN